MQGGALAVEAGFDIAALAPRIVEAAANAIFVTDVEGRIVWVNRSFTALTGFTPEEAIGRTPRILQSGRRNEAFFHGMWNTILSGRVWRGETVNRRKDGSVYTVQQAITPVRNERGVITHFVSINHDITERRRAEDAQARLIAVIEATTDFVGTASLDGHVRYINRAGRGLLGIPEDADVTTLRIPDCHPDWARDLIVQEGIPTAVATGVWSGETALLSHDGREIAVSQVILAHKAPDGIVEFISTIMRDITERRRSAETLRQTEKVAAMGQLLAGVAHELNNPLAVVTAYCQLLMKDAEGALAIRARKVMEAAERCARIVKNFLALARQSPPEKQEVSINDVVREALELLAYPLRVDNVEVTLDLSPEVPFLYADGHQLHQVFVNLMTNAHQAMREVAGRRRLVLTTRFDPVRARVTATVADSGPGIPAVVRARIFEPFFTTKPPGQGTGLGLSLCQSIVDSHGGTIGVESGPAPGAAFTIELPVQPAPRLGRAPAAPRAPAIAPRSILVVDDEPEVAAVLQEMLATDGHRVDVAPNGKAALDRILNGHYDLVLSDFKMPELDGPELYRRLVKLGHPLARHFIFVTGDTLGEETRDFLQRAQAVCVNKPFADEDVRRAVWEASAPV